MDRERLGAGWAVLRGALALAALGVAGCTCGTVSARSDSGPGGDAGGADGGVDASADAAGGGDGGGGGADAGGGGSDAATLGPGECRGDMDCTPGADYCRGPEELPICGACRLPSTPCASDTDCLATGPTFICAPVVCGCTGEGDCVPGCTSDAECDTTWQECAADNHCRGRTCGGGAFVCPDPFDCAPGTGICTRRICSTDAVCAGDYCVEGACYDVPGTCQPRFPP